VSEARASATPATRVAVSATSPPLVAEPGASLGAASAILRRESTFRRLLGIADAVAITAALAFAALILGEGDGLTLAAGAVPLLLVAVAKAIGLYDRDAHLLHKTTLDEVPALFSIATLSALMLWISGGAFVEGELDRAQIVPLWGLLFLLLLGLRSLARSLARRLTAAERCLFVGDPASAEQLREKLAASQAVEATLVGWIPAGSSGNGADGAAESNGDGHLNLAERVRALVAERDVHRVVLGPGPAHSDDVLDAIRQIKDHGLEVSVLPDVSRVVSSSVEVDRLNGLTLLGVRRFEITHSSRVVKRAFDIAGSAIALLCLSSVLLAVAAAILLTSRGPVLFRQVRAGRHGESFQMLKFRSMVEGAEAQRDDLMHLNESDGLFKIADDPRITAVGRVIRRFHIDELPQLVNVLRGDMSLVGPRPLVLEEDRRIEGWHRRRLDLRPGITGPWQVLGASRIPVSEMVRLDYQYVADWSLWNDIRILMLTVPVIIRRRGL